MEFDEIQTQKLCKFQKTSQFGEEEENKEIITKTSNNGNQLSGWHHQSSRIVRFSKASGGKDRHSKVWTSKGLRDRRVRLSVTTAIQFFDLQDRLGYDQPSKALEWLIKAAADSIAELPSLNTSFLDEEKNENVDRDFYNQNQTVSLSKSACSSNSDSCLSLSRSEIRGNRVKTWERATVRTRAREKENHNLINKSTFTELLTGSVNANHYNHSNETGWTGAAPPDNFSLDQMPYQTVSMSMITPPLSLLDGDDNHHHGRRRRHHQEFPFSPDHLISAVSGGGGSYDLDFNVSSGYCSRGTLQSNSQQSFFNSLQRFSSEAASVRFLSGAAPEETNNHHHLQRHQFHLYDNDVCRNSDQMDKGKS